MKHVNAVSKAPDRAQELSPEVMIEFIIAILTALIPVLEMKNPTPPTS